MKILVHFPFEPQQLEALRRLAGQQGHELLHADDEAAALQAAPQIEVLLGHFLPSVCAAAPQLRWIQSFSAGMDKFLFPEIVAREEVVITNMAGLYASQGGEHAWALLLALCRGLHRAVRIQDQKQWRGGPVVELTGSTMGIIGMGGFGLEILKRARGYDLEVLALDPVRREKPEEVAELNPPTEEHLHDLLKRSDAVMIACPRVPETYHLIGPAQFACMKPSAYLVNVTRGGIIDEPALVQALKEGRLAGAGLDVCEQEPLPAGSPLWEAPNLILTPHQAGASQHRPRKTFEFFRENLSRYLNGQPLLNVVDKKRGF
ncbi:MAG: D-2-hydroxyacid dehydrogenase [Candidatus Latescibacteria bacterium]|nr:D-2-hydroxyacid dehydrogenase [Candidatus Latescibacterota bacterium]